MGCCGLSEEVSAQSSCGKPRRLLPLHSRRSRTTQCCTCSGPVGVMDCLRAGGCPLTLSPQEAASRGTRGERKRDSFNSFRSSIGCSGPKVSFVAMAKRVRFSFGTRRGMSKRRLLLRKRSHVRRPATSASGQKGAMQLPAEHGRFTPTGCQLSVDWPCFPRKSQARRFDRNGRLKALGQERDATCKPLAGTRRQFRTPREKANLRSGPWCSAHSYTST